MAQDHLLEALVGLRVLDHRQPRRHAGAGAQQVQVLAGVQVADQQGAGGLLADQHLVARLDVLQARGQRAVLHLDAEELQVLFPVGAGDGVRAQQRPRLGFQADHHELAVLEAESAVAGEGEAEVGIGPVTDLKHRFGAKSGGHGRSH
ncbi:hypothetical protein G6F40_015443 [Rhizopus arrhizus]|nr:hypothetical protein G6F40_015443 [Rhizopus arrhizus]